MRILFIALLGVLMAASGFGQAQGDIPFKVIERGANIGEKEQGLKVLRTDRAFEEFLKDKGEEHVKKLAKQVDWQTEQVVVIFGGQHPTGGFSVDVKRIAKVDVQRLIVEAILNKPKPGQGVTMAFTTPYIIIKMPREVAAIKVKFLDSSG